ncbi:dual specificity testis-specific protein kinase 2 [Aplysia californica]|uniref:dual-specificity kinase n=1 Tax=Aplysia californica TaxID=6500 RepID=A0ABM0ZZW3_APLCA|nr:dual specificity testis-specific protein kinase 2 [Aplysia californica]
MSGENSSGRQVGKPILRQLRRSKTITVSEYVEPGQTAPHEVSFSVEGSEPTLPSPQPTSSCQALRHAVSALTRIDDFFLEELGSGFFANVYKATHRVTGEEMVMKINKDSSNRHNALREVQLMNRLSHPNILRLLGVCVHEGQLHGLSEYISGGTLEMLLSSKTEELPWTVRLKLSLDIARGMHYLHMDGVFHRDLTSKNVLIRKGENKNYQAIIADFGLATKIPDPQATEPLPSVGCPWWMAPEVINGKFYDERADLFSFGIINLELTARIDADPETMPRTQSFGVDYVRFCEMVEYCPLDFLQLTFKCCQIRQEKRPESSVIISTLEQIYKNLRTNSLSHSGKLHKRSRSEDNIIQSSDSFIGGDDVFMTPQIIAQAMSKDDPHYSPANVNPFATISKFKDGRKVLELPRSRKSSGSSNGFASSSGLSCGRSGDLLTTSFNAGYPGESERQKSQSLPSSPIMLRRAAEKMHQASLHGSEAVRVDVCPELEPSLSGDLQDNSGDDNAVPAADRRARFGCNRTRSLGALDFWSPLAGANRRGKKKKGGQEGQVAASNSEKLGYCNRDTGGIRESSFEDGLGSSECLDGDESFCSEDEDPAESSLVSNPYGSVQSEGGEEGEEGSVRTEGEEEGEVSSVAPYGSCQESVSSGSLSSFVSCAENKEEEERDAVDGGEERRKEEKVVGLQGGEEEKKERLHCLPVNPSDGGLGRRPLAEKKVVTNSGESRPLIALESGSYNSDHYSSDTFGKTIVKNGSSKSGDRLKSGDC